MCLQNTYRCFCDEINGIDDIPVGSVDADFPPVVFVLDLNDISQCDMAVILREILDWDSPVVVLGPKSLFGLFDCVGLGNFGF